MQRSTYNCPACRKRMALYIHPVGSIRDPETSIEIWCDNIDCNDKICDEGGEGPSQSEAFQNLIEKREKQP